MPQSAPLAKLSPPRLSGILRRETRYACIDMACKGGALWVQGPPGAGKTMLLGGYCQERGRPVLWYRLDDGDEDPAAFFHYLSRAAGYCGHDGADDLPRLCGECSEAIRPFARHYFRELFAGLPPDAILVFDDCHVLDDDAAIFPLLSAAIDELPAGQGICFIGRNRPPAVFSAPLLAEHLHSLHWHDLRLDGEEMKRLCRLRLGGAEPAAEEIEAICTASQGWVAGLVLMLEQYRRGGYCPTDPPHPPQTHVELFNYFAAEVFGRLPIAEQGFLMRTALFPAFTAEMADRLTRHGQAEAVLEGLTANNFFTTRRVREVTEYEYHPLFRSFLLTRLERTLAPEALQRLRERAADVLGRQRYWHDAAALYGQAGAWESLADLCEARAPHLLDIGGNRALIRELQRVPESVLEQKPWLLLYYGAAACHADIVLAREKYILAHERFRASGEVDGAALAWCGIVETYIYQWGDFSALDHWLETSADLIAPATFDTLPPTTRARLCVAMFTALMYRQPWHESLPLWARRIEDIVENGEDTRLSMKTGIHLLMYHAWWSGDLPRARRLVDRLERRAAKSALDPLTRIVWHAIEAAYAWMAGEQDRALASMQAGREIATANQLHHFDFMLSAQGAWAHITREAQAEAQTLLDAMQNMMRPGRTLDVCHYHYLRSMLLYQQHDGATMLEYAVRARDLAREAGCPWAEGIMETAVGRAWHLLGDTARARKHLHRSLTMARHHRSGITERGALLGLAELELDRGDRVAGLACLQRAFRWCGRHGATVWSAWRNDTVAWLCGIALEEGIEPAFAHRLIRERGLAAPDAFRMLPDWPWPVRIHTFGRFAIVIDGKTLSIRGKAQGKPLELLKLLIALGGRGITQGILADLLWPDAEGDAARRTFDSTLHRLRKLLGVGDLLLLQDGRLTLDTRKCWVDAWSFDIRTRRLCERLRGGRTDAATLKTGLDLLALYQGRFLQGEELPGIEERAERYGERYLHLALAVGDGLEAHDRAEEALEVYRQAQEYLPLEDRLYLARIRLLVVLERQAEALRVYRQCERRLGETAGLRPSPSLVAMVESLANR